MYILGAGAFGTVYYCYNSDTRQHVAVKEFKELDDFLLEY